MVILATKQLHICNGFKFDGFNIYVNEYLVFIDISMVFHIHIYPPWKKMLGSDEFVGIEGIN